MSTVMPIVAPAAAIPATAVEVVTSLGGSIVSVDTLTATTASRRRGWAFIGVGAALLMLGLGTFLYGVAGAKHDAAARAQWTAEKRPSWAFRPTRHGAGADLAALLGAVVGLGLVATGLMRRTGAARTRLRVGQNDGVDIPLADAPPERTLVERDGAGGFVTSLDGLDGEVAFAGTATTLASMRAAGHVALPLYVGTQVRTTIGHASFFVRGIAAPARSAPAGFGWEARAFGFVAASAVAHFGLLAMVRSAAPDEQGAPTDMSLSEDTSLRAVSTGHEEPDPLEPEVSDDDDGGGEGAATSPTAVALEDGTLGTNRANPNPARLQVQNHGGTPKLSREQALAIAAESGILASSVFSGPIAVADGANLADGFDDLDITGGFYDGGGQGAPAGSFGWGVRGTGRGCGNVGGLPCSGIASDAFMTAGNDGSDSYTGPLGNGTPNTRRHVNLIPTVTISKPTTCKPNSNDATDCLDGAIIRRYVKRNIEKIKYCYERELLARPDLDGTVTALFTLNANGVVIDSKASGVDPAVSSCIAQVISSIAFPKVAESGIFPIKYPFQLHRR